MLLARMIYAVQTLLTKSVPGGLQEDVRKTIEEQRIVGAFCVGLRASSLWKWPEESDRLKKDGHCCAGFTCAW